MIVIPLQQYELQVFVFTKVSELREFGDKLGVVFRDPKSGGGTCYYDVDGHCPITIFLGKPTAGIIAHECVHAAHAVFDTIGIKPDLVNDEAMAYLVGYLVESITSNIVVRKRRDWEQSWGSSISSFPISELNNYAD